MTTDEIIKSLRACVNGNCNECREQLGIKCYDALALTAADELEKLNNIGYWLMKLMKGENDG